MFRKGTQHSGTVFHPLTMLSPPIASSTPTILAPENDGGVGLSDPVTAHRRRKMLDLINRLRNTG